GLAGFVAGAAAFSLLGGTCKAPPLEDTIGIHGTKPLGQTAPQAGDGWIPPRSHNSLFTSVHQQPAPAVKRPAEGKTCFMPRNGFGALGAHGFGALDTSAFRRMLRFRLSARRNLSVSPVVEVNGIEPMTSCLQSR